MTIVMKKNVEKRKFARINFDAHAYISYGGRTFRAQVEDLSTKSARVVTDAPVPMGEFAEVVIVRGKVQVMFYAKVSRATMRGLVFSDTKSTESKLGRLFFAAA